MHLFTLEVFDDVISGTGTDWYSTALHNNILGTADVFAIQAVTTGVSGTSPTLTVRLQLIIDRICVVIPANLDQEKTLERTSEDNPTRWTVAA